MQSAVQWFVPVDTILLACVIVGTTYANTLSAKTTESLIAGASVSGLAEQRGEERVLKMADGSVTKKLDKARSDDNSNYLENGGDSRELL